MKKKARKIILVFVIAIIVISPLIFQTNEAHATVPGPRNIKKAVVSGLINLSVDVFAKFVAFLTTLEVSILALLLAAVQAIAGWMLDLQYEILKSPTVDIGWQIVRDIANSFFVLILLIMAFATILRIQSYGMKQLLWKLIVAAALINFSFLIASIFIDFTNSVTQYFITQSGSADSFAFAKNLSGAFAQPQKALETDAAAASILKTVENAGNALITIIFGAVFAIIYMFTILTVILSFAALLFVRYITLSFLVILAPLAWLFWVIPEFSGHTKSWWNNFLKWCFFAPAAAFFIFLSTQIIGGGSNNCGYFSNSSKGCPQTLQAEAFTSGLQKSLVTQNVLANLGQMTLNMGLLLGSLIAANKMGIEGSSAALKFAKAPTTWLQNRSKAGALRTRDRLMASRTAQGGMRGAANIMSRVPGLRNLSLGLAGAAGSAREREDAHWTNRYKHIGNIEQFNNIARAASTPAQAAALARLGQEKKFFGADKSLKRDEVRRLAQLLSKPEDKKAQEELLKTIPTLKQELTGDSKELEKFANRIYDAANILADEFRMEEGKGLNDEANVAKKTWILNMTTGVAGQVADQGGEKAEALRGSLERMWNERQNLSKEEYNKLLTKVDHWNARYSTAGNKLYPQGYKTAKQRRREEERGRATARRTPPTGTTSTNPPAPPPSDTQGGAPGDSKPTGDANNAGGGAPDAQPDHPPPQEDSTA